MDTEKLELARTFLDNVRLTQKESGKLARGRNRLSSETSDAMNIQLDSISKLIDILELPNDTAKKLCERFEEICRRRRMKMIDEIRREIYELLIFELSINTQELEMEPDQLVSVTLLSEVPAGFILQEKEFEWFKGNLGIVKRAAEKYSNPREFLRTVKETVEEILEEEEFKDFWETPWMVLHAAVHNPTDPRRLLRKVIKTVEGFLEKEKFKCFRTNKWVIRHAALKYSKPEKFLSTVKRTVKKILREKEFAGFKKTSWIVLHAAVHYPDDPRRFLRTVKETVEEILEEEEFKCFSKNKWVIQHAAVKHSKPKKFLRTVKETVEEILEDKEFERFKNSLGIVLKAVVWHSSDPKDFLRSQPTSSL